MTTADLTHERIADLIDFPSSANGPAEVKALAAEVQRRREEEALAPADMKTLSVTVSITSDVPELLEFGAGLLARIKGDKP
jgi:hypothetical protein